MSRWHCPLCGNYNPDARETNKEISSATFADIQCGTCNRLVMVCLPKHV